MSTYTEFLEYEGCDIYPEDDNYTEKLLEFAKKFRYFDEALTEFMCEQGYEGDVTNIDEKVSFLRKKFEVASIEVPRNLKKWFTEHIRVKRTTAFQICFAFGLDVKETNDFFRRIYLERGFDCHYIEEAIYYYGIKHSLSYKEVKELVLKAPKPQKEKIDFSKEILFTSSIVDEIDRFQNTKDLMKFFEENISQFGYNSATAYKYMNEIWSKIAVPNGLAIKEKNELFFDVFTSEKEKKRKVPSNEKQPSVWEIYLQILGFDKEMISVLQTDRSITPILKGNVLLHPVAQESFPDRAGIQSILVGEHISCERVRKMMILLVFYKFWVTCALKRKDETYRAEPGEADRCLSEINKYLKDAGYPAMYLGNPFDWVFMYAMQDEFPLATFREFMHELFVMKEDELDINKKYEIEKQ